MGWISMSERDLKRIEVLNEVQSGGRTVAAAASVLGISERQAYRLLSRYQEDGGFGLVHKARGCESNRSLNPGIPFAFPQLFAYLLPCGRRAEFHNADAIGW